MTVTRAAQDIEDLANALYGLSAIRRDLQRCAGIEHAAGALMALGAVRRLGPARISDVAADLQVNLSVASRQLQTLQSDGYVDRVADPHDGRSSLVALSPAGRAKLEAAHERLFEALGRAVGDWRPEQVSGLAEGIVRLRSALSHPGPTELPAAGAAEPTAHAAPASGRSNQEQNR
jgi:DNA-binding MarR family transcriptional regulator